jgi:Right handed beta helix region
MAICGTAMLSGPSSAPAGAVSLSPGPSTIQNAITQHPNGGTTYYLSAGTYAIDSSINPNNNDTFIGAPGAIIDGSNNQPVAFGFNDHASGVTIKYLTIEHFVGPQNNGIVNQGQGAGWTLQYNSIQDNPRTNGGAAGIYLGDSNVISYNCFSRNGEMGIGSASASGFVVDHNEVAFNAQGYEAIYNCGCSGGMKLFETTKGTVTNNWIHDNDGVGLWIDTNNSFFLVQNNVIENNFAEGLFYEISYNAVIENNVFRLNNIGKNRSNGNFPNGAVYISESGGFDAGPPVLLSGVDVNGTLRIAHNTFDDNANGVVLWQSSTRCCGTSGGCASSCAPVPLYPEPDPSGNQRWKTQNVLVEDNAFALDADAGCVASAPAVYCGVSAIFSNNSAVDQAIAFQQNNIFKNNTYKGSWLFLAPDQSSSLLSPASWQAPPYSQDVGSTFR